MRLRILPPLLAAVLVVLAGCATTPADRIRRDPALFAKFPAEVQERIRAGQVEIGDPAAAVLLALGEPVQRMNRRTAEGETEVWIYGRHRGEPRLRFNVGIGTNGAHTGVAVGAGLATGDRSDLSEETMRLELADGRVVRIESRPE